MKNRAKYRHSKDSNQKRKEELNCNRFLLVKKMNDAKNDESKYIKRNQIAK